MDTISWTDCVKSEDAGLLHGQAGRGSPTYNKTMKANWIGPILRRNCLIKHVIEGEIEEKVEGKRRWGRRRKQLLRDLFDKRRCWNLKEVALDRTVERTSFETGYGSVSKTGQ